MVTLRSMKRSYVLSFIVFVSMGVFIFLTWFIYFKANSNSHSPLIDKLPLLNCILNGLSAICLCFGIVEIKRKNQNSHKRFMLSAFVFSTLFLISYLIYHQVHGDSHFLGVGIVRPIYFFILISHILLTFIGLPLILSTFYLALSNQISIHKKFAKWTFPIWLYISVTGVLIYVFLKAFS